MMSQTPVTRLPSEQSELIEEALAEIFRCFEDGKMKLDEVRKALETDRIRPNVLEKLEKNQYVLVKDDRVLLTEKGKELGMDVIRRLRLSERLLTDVLNMKSGAIESTACRFEHILSMEVTDSICTLLGHPSRCPHERSIPGGECCKKAQSTVSSVVVSLDRLEPDRRARIAYLLFKNNPELNRILSLGVVPGQGITLIQRVPTFVVQVNESQLAFDEAVAREIFVRPL